MLIKDKQPRERREKRVKKQTSFYSEKQDTRFNVDFSQPSFGAPGIELYGPHIEFGKINKNNKNNKNI